MPSGMTAFRDSVVEAAFARMDPFWPLVVDNVPPNDGIVGLWRIADQGSYETYLSMPDSSLCSAPGARIWARMMAIPPRMLTPSDANTFIHTKVSLQHVWPHSFLLEFADGAGIKVLPPEHLRKRRDCPLDITDCIPPHQTAVPFKVTIQFDPKLPSAAELHYVLAIVKCMPQEPSAILNGVPIEDVGVSSSRIRSILSRKEYEEDELQISGSSDEVDGETRALRLTCPLSYARMEYPARGRDCTHIQCFDLEWFIRAQKMMAAFNNRWKCAVCDAVLRPDKILIDGFILAILRATKGTQAEEVFVTKSTAEWSLYPPNHDGTTDGRDPDGCCSYSTASTRSSAVDGHYDKSCDTDVPLKRARLDKEYLGGRDTVDGGHEENYEEVVDLCDDSDDG
ncbi:sumo ligase, putative [Perkinsus marinus ATCC 50983]|uniref:Sumo ligase, putative n=1 Tax=Perkinsus marinus (strain ATCC 50983 / TXsc) TaxID=423536 RepID=C5L949_PERM5|nr:sumo ligase, putative [Perkinsus marinus ATCC 50983]EER06762.1 sumo ligase, putative [Perkinsus marinus ATCC 50983]|eukprot:XP_002774946.1 sumo ligase, putative [Perkinsus marinus ATCC 50983]